MVCNLKRMHKLRVFGFVFLALGTLASAFLALAKHHGWPYQQILIGLCVICYGVSIFLLCCYGYRHGTKEQQISMTLDLIMVAILSAVLNCAYLFALWRRPLRPL